MIVIGPHRRSGFLGHLQGSVAAAVVAHATTPVLVVPEATPKLTPELLRSVAVPH